MLVGLGQRHLERRCTAFDTFGLFVHFAEFRPMLISRGLMTLSLKRADGEFPDISLPQKEKLVR
jgi:hypothetical protein